MSSTPRLEISALGAALVLGILGDALLRCFPWGVNFALWGVFFAAVILVLGRRARRMVNGSGSWLLMTLLLGALAFVWRESPWLKALSLLAVLTVLSLAALQVRSVRLRSASMLQYVLGSALAGFNAAFGVLPLLLRRRERNNDAGSRRLRNVVAVLLGLALAVPPLFLFGALLMNADAVFSTLVRHAVRAAPAHVFCTAVIAYVTTGYLRGLLFADEKIRSAPKRLLPVALGAIETGVVLSLLDLLFLAFVTVQVRYFFGGSARVHAVTGLTFAEYARRGFFELLTAAALLLPFLLAVHWLLRPDDMRAQQVFRWLAGFLIALLFVIMVSAVQRMHLYVIAYGLSEQRLYSTAFMGWLAEVFVWFLLTVLRGQRQRFAFGAMVTGFALVAALYAIDPDALIARTNLARARAGALFDPSYISHLSSDAVPESVAGLPVLKSGDRCRLAQQLLERWPPDRQPEWRSWTVSGARARRAISEQQVDLRAACGRANK